MPPESRDRRRRRGIRPIAGSRGGTGGRPMRPDGSAVALRRRAGTGAHLRGDRDFPQFERARGAGFVVRRVAGDENRIAGLEAQLAVREFEIDPAAEQGDEPPRRSSACPRCPRRPLMRPGHARRNAGGDRASGLWGPRCGWAGRPVGRAGRKRFTRRARRETEITEKERKRWGHALGAGLARSAILFFSVLSVSLRALRVKPVYAGPARAAGDAPRRFSRGLAAARRGGCPSRPGPRLPAVRTCPRCRFRCAACCRG